MPNLPRQFNRGFSLLEMTVVIGIVAVMTAIVLFNLPQMKGGVSIELVAQEVAIYIRGAQVYSRATKTSSDPGGSKEFYSFGMHFETATPDSFFLWADRDDRANRSKHDGQPDEYFYNQEVDIPSEETYNLPKGFVIAGLEVFKENDVKTSVSQLDVLYKKPDPEANFGCNGASCESIGSIHTAQITLTSPNRAQTRCVRVSSNGQILVVNPANDSRCVAKSP